jgi:hypothetical protein
MPRMAWSSSGVTVPSWLASRRANIAAVMAWYSSRVTVPSWLASARSMPRPALIMLPGVGGGVSSAPVREPSWLESRL